MGFFKEMISEGTKSSVMRFCTIMIVVVGLGIIVYQALMCDAVDWFGCCSLVGIGLTGKVSQKAFEKSIEQA